MLLLAVAFSFQLSIAQSTWKVDKAHSSISFSVSHFMISEVTGNFKQFDIEATAGAQFENPSFDVSIAAGSIDTNQGGRDNHLKAPDFFDVKNHAQITFKSESFTAGENGTFTTKGTITIKGVRKEVVFKGKLNGVIKTRNGKHKAGLKLTTQIKREDFNLGKGMTPIGKDVTVTVHLEMNQQ